jgi:hypothetical protein
MIFTFIIDGCIKYWINRHIEILIDLIVYLWLTVLPFCNFKSGLFMETGGLVNNV